MKLLITAFVFIYSFLISSPNVFAHGAGLPPFFKINSKYSNFYPLYAIATAVSDINLPQDLAPDNYLADQSIDFEIDTNQLAIPLDIISKTTFNWDFGDGTKASGLKNSHIYQKSGSYTITIFGTTNQSGIGTPQLLESVFLNVLPNKDYELPKAVIKINGRESKDEFKDTFEFDLANKLTFDASASTGKITKYLWDFGDSQSNDKSVVDHKYKLPQYYATSVLRVIDENGFISDVFVTVKNNGNNSTNNSSQNANMIKRNTAIFLSALGLIVLISAVLIFFAIRSRKEHGN